ncbi:MAG: type I methionyl aminopeptidase [Saprospiraceae bacterium]|nr:type I methionyl aminopeptidase [Saprospiraceae bacterium]MCF8251745.1 type I methionyl aminopeptidase [Saprospiraceae bacterium]MCF8281231.1 type I methionyl aminopeptidase [Bacteroidales bacterium]MCF8313387.1 type I methionyl aminopeptidase [Saprospiraceae bacterium]MCF8442100.1 type I methionyl aminopeptidase [Saprospiraceae bacterium]
MIFYKTDEEIELIREACLLVCKVLTHVGANLKAGMKGSKLDREAEELIRDNGATPAFKGYVSSGADVAFPSTLCISVNEAVVHGIPSEEEEFKDGDIVSVDCGTFLNGYYGDAAYTFALGNVDEATMELLRITKTSLYKGIEQAVHGKRIGDIGYAIQSYTERAFEYSVVRELVGHGVGKSLHEDPEVPNYGKRGSGVLMKEGLVIAIEPMINMGKKEVMQGKDGWTIMSSDRKPSAHYEHTIAVRKQKADILSNHDPIEAAIAMNPELKTVEAKENIGMVTA